MNRSSHIMEGRCRIRDREKNPQMLILSKRLSKYRCKYLWRITKKQGEKVKSLHEFYFSWEKIKIAHERKRAHVSKKKLCTFSFEFCENWCGKRGDATPHVIHLINLGSARVKCILCSNQFNHKQIELSTAVKTFTFSMRKQNEHRLCPDHPNESTKVV